MSLFAIAKIEIKKNLKSTLIYSLIMALFVLLVASIFDPDLFVGMEGMMEAFPDAILEIIGGVFDLGTFGGFFSMEFMSMIWMWVGIYYVLKAGQDIPSTIENKTIDLILSKPLKRWEFVLGRYLRFVWSIFTVMLSMLLVCFILIKTLPNLKDQDIDYVEFIVALSWAFIFILALTTTAFFFSVFMNRKKATGAAFGLIVLLFVIGTFYSYFDPNIQDMKYLSLFFYYEPSRILISHSYENILRDCLILSGYTTVLTIASVVIFNKRDIPV